MGRVGETGAIRSVCESAIRGADGSISIVCRGWKYKGGGEKRKDASTPVSGGEDLLVQLVFQFGNAGRGVSIHLDAGGRPRPLTVDHSLVLSVWRAAGSLSACPALRRGKGGGRSALSVVPSSPVLSPL